MTSDDILPETAASRLQKDKMFMPDEILHTPTLRCHAQR
jgi:hypothetical protein